MAHPGGTGALAGQPKVRVMVVDDSVVTRRILTDTIASSPELEVVGTASGGRLALAKLDSLSPDVLTLDVEMPDMDGLATLKELRLRRPTLPVLMCSSMTERGAAVTMDALALGASDYVTKPTALTSGGAQGFAAVLLPKLLALGRRGSRGSEPRLPPVVAAQRPLSTAGRPPAPVEVVVLGISTGGPNALAEILPALGGPLPVPLLIVQHMPPIFTRLLAERLTRLTRFRVAEAVNGEALEPGGVYIAPGDSHLAIAGSLGARRAVLNSDPPENSCRPAVDVLFRSAAAAYGAGVLALVLTGMGQDGLRGSEIVRAAGGRILVQDEATSVVWGMPGYVAQAGLAEDVLPLKEIAAAIVKRMSRSSRRS